MSGRFRQPLARVLTCSMLSLASGLALADVVTESTMSVDGVGAMAFGNMTGTTRTTVSGDKARTDSDVQMKSRLVRMLAHSSLGPTAQIVRLDQDKIYQVNINKKEYTETTFEQMRSQLDRMSDQMDEAAQKQQQQPAALDDSKCEWLPPRVDVRKTGEKQQIAGYQADQVTIVAAQPCKDKSTGAICELTLALDEWLATGFAENAELQKYHKAYAAKLGLDINNGQALSQRAQSMFGRYKGIWGEITSKMKDVKGYPVKTTFMLAMGGEQCQSAHQTQAQAESPGQSSGGAPPTSPGALAGQVAGKLGSLFHKKKDESEAAAASAAAPATPAASILPAGEVALMTMTSQLVSVSNTPAAADAFEIPPGFTRRELKSPQ
jgi:hypothetical protein